MRRETTLLFLVSCAAFAGLACAKVVRTFNQSSGPQTNPQCLDREKYAAAVKQLSSHDQTEADQAAALLVTTSRISSSCKSEVIAVIMNGMNKPDLDFDRDADSYWLWRHGSDLLGDLHATEALDLLVSHLDSRTKMFSSSMDHMPALSGVIKMGASAMPRLDAVLKHDPKPGMRHAAVYCIATIGGPSAVKSLREAIPTESNECVSRFIRISLENFDESGKIKDRGKWFSGISCDE